MMMSAGAGGQAQPATGSSQQIGKSAALTVGALALARAGAATAALNDHQKLAALLILSILTCAREAPPIPASCATELRRADRPARAGAAAAGRRRHFFLADCCSQIRWGDDGARPIWAIDDDVGGRRRASAASYGVIATDRKICSTDSGGACSRSRRCGDRGTERSSEIGRVTHTLYPHVRARGAADTSELCDRAAPSRPTGSSRRCGCWSTSPFLFSGLLFADFGATMELGRSGRSMMMSAGAGGQAQPATGSSQQIGKSAALTVGALALARAGCGGRGTERSSEFGRVTHTLYPHVRANNRETRRLLTNRPGLSFIRRVRFQRTSTRQQLDCAKTLSLCNQGNRRILTSDGLSTCS